MSILNPYLWLAVLMMMAASYGTGRFQQYKSDKAEHTQALLKATNEAREKERIASIEQGKVVDELLAKNSATAAERDAVSERLRKLSTGRSQLATSCARSDEAPGAVLSDETRSALVAEAKRADEVVNQLTAAQEQIRVYERACRARP